MPLIDTTKVFVVKQFRYLVKDEEGNPMRRFYWKDEAIRFLQEGWTLVRIPRKPKVNIFEVFEPAPF